MTALKRPLTFKVVQSSDVTGVSGEGHVADGVVFVDGTTVLRWRTETNSTAVYDSYAAMVKIHGHNGATSFVFDYAKGGYVNAEENGSAVLGALRDAWRADYKDSVEFKNAVLKVVYDNLRKEYSMMAPYSILGLN